MYDESLLVVPNSAPVRGGTEAYLTFGASGRGFLSPVDSTGATLVRLVPDTAQNRRLSGGYYDQRCWRWRKE